MTWNLYNPVGFKFYSGITKLRLLSLLETKSVFNYYRSSNVSFVDSISFHCTEVGSLYPQLLILLINIFTGSHLHILFVIILLISTILGISLYSTFPTMDWRLVWHYTLLKRTFILLTFIKISSSLFILLIESSLIVMMFK